MLAVFCDFDGTFAVQDVGSTLARRHLGARRSALWAEFERGEGTAWEYAERLFDGFDLPEAELLAFLETIDLDPGAQALVAWCAKRDVPFRVVSDGFDYNLDRLQDIHGLRFDYTANGLRYEQGRWRIRAGGPNAECGCGTGICKRSVIESWRLSHPNAFCVHIGDGRVSDTCGALAADLTFAKSSLAEELERRGAPFERFTVLNDVIASLERRFSDFV
jgi:2,3-diketo-5-methylthio-1-phosphopentane phosphatase